MPSPASAYTNQLWYVQAGSGGLLSLLNIYKYPKGFYSPNASNVWEQVSMNVKVAEDSTTLVNITNWAEFFAYAFDINIGSRLIYNGKTYTNLTGAQTATAPDTDTTNWSYPDLNAKSVQFDPNAVILAYQAGQISFDPNSLVHLLDTGVDGVRIQAGQEEYFLVYNSSAVTTILNGKACFASGVDATEEVLTIGLADNSSFITSAQVLGLATHDILPLSLGLVTERGIVRDWPTDHLSFGLTYLGTLGNLTSVKPLYPANRIAMGALLKSHATEGKFQVAISTLPRRNASRSYTFTSANAAAGTHWRAGFYDWATASVTLNQGSLTVNHGAANVTRAAHVGMVAEAAGVVDTGQVGLQVTGTEDTETGPQIAAQTSVITDDITTLTANQMLESIKKFSGTVTLSLYIVSGAPTAYSLTFNYGYSKYEDFANIDGTVTAFNAVWEAGANDSSFDVSLIFHNENGWTYAAAGFVAGNGNICNRLTDQAIDSDLANGEEGAYKRINLNQFISGTSTEGVIIEIITGSTNTIRSMDMHITAFSEELN